MATKKGQGSSRNGRDSNSQRLGVKRFDGNVVTEYTYEESVIDNVNVDFSVYRIKTEVTESGTTIAKGDIVIKKSDGVKQALEYMQRLTKVMPADVFAWDDASNNKYIISGQGSMIMNPPFTR